MASLLAINNLISIIQNHSNNNKKDRKGHAQSDIALQFKWKDIDKNADRNVLKQLKKYKVINGDDVKDRDTVCNVSEILKRFKSLISQKNDDKKYKFLILVRHGEGLHNWAKWEKFGPEEWINNQSTDLKWKDPSLTETGVGQVKKILPEFECLKSEIHFIVSSPLRRAMQTMSHAILPIVETEKYKYECPVYVLEYTRERINHHACDSRNDFDQIKEEWQQYDFIYDGFETNKDIEWNVKEDERRERLWTRSQRFLDFVWNHEGDVAVYSGHCDFIMSCMELIDGMPFYKPRNAAFFPCIITTM